VDRSINDNFKFNQETEFVPMLGLVASELNAPQNPDKFDTNDAPTKVIASSIQENHHPALLSVLAEELSVTSEEIHDFELYVLVILTTA
jgi:aspartyl aminopeptidase